MVFGEVNKESFIVGDKDFGVDLIGNFFVFFSGIEKIDVLLDFLDVFMKGDFEEIGVILVLDLDVIVDVN